MFYSMISHPTPFPYYYAFMSITNKLRDVMCTLVAIIVILRRLECSVMRCMPMLHNGLQVD